jgi:uncharacterized glyoxalase superfamily protein PhnB
MELLKTAFPLFQVESPAAAAEYYVNYFDFERIFEIDWYAQIRHGTQELAFVTAGHESIPPERHGLSKNVCLTLEVECVDLAYNRVRHAMKTVIQPRDEEWGQRHFLGYDPAGIMLDVMAMLPNAVH